MKYTQEELTKLIDDAISLENVTIKEFGKNIVARPDHTLGWADAVFKSAAKLGVYTDIKKNLDAIGKEMNVSHGRITTFEMALETIKRNLVDELMNGAKYPERSTSPCSNLLEREQLSASAQIYERFFGNGW